MKFETFTAGHWQPRYQYESFEPVSVNHEWRWEDPQINFLLESATKSLGELNAFSLIVPDIDLFVKMHVAKEAQTSSRIEGTRTGMEEVLMPEDQIDPEKRNDWREVRNYIDAINIAIDKLRELPLSNRLLKETHAILMQGVRGEHKRPGEFRTSQNWIGGSSLNDAAFIPPHHDNVMDLMSDLERFLNNDALRVPHLVRVAIAHYQFETIHPFLDGNGRIGRLLIPLYMISHGLLQKPALYLSDFFERNRASYYDALMRVRIANDMIHWVRFFLQGVNETATKGREVFHRILQLRTETESKILALNKRATPAKEVLNMLYQNPVINANQISASLGIAPATANSLLNNMTKLGIIREVTGGKRYRRYLFESYLNLFI